MPTDQSSLRFIEKGRSQPTDALMRQAAASLRVVRANRDSLERCGFASDQAAALIDELLADLACMLGPRPAGRALPQATAHLWECKGRLLEAIEELNRAGQRALCDDAEAAGFNDAILARGRQPRDS